jgi:hypothetical protein
MTEIVVKINEIKAGKPYGEGAMIAQPVSDLLYKIELQDEHYSIDHEGNVVLSDKGVRYVNKILKTLLYWDQDEQF